MADKTKVVSIGSVDFTVSDVATLAALVCSLSTVQIAEMANGMSLNNRDIVMRTWIKTKIVEAECRRDGLL